MMGTTSHQCQCPKYRVVWNLLACTLACCVSRHSQSFQKSLIKEYALNHIEILLLVWDRLEALGSGVRWPSLVGILGSPVTDCVQVVLRCTS